MMSIEKIPVIGPVLQIRKIKDRMDKANEELAQSLQVNGQVLRDLPKK